MKGLRIGYLVSRYPAISHTFILREVQELRRLGFDISVASINDVDRKSHQLTAEESAEVGKTFYVKKAGWKGALRSQWEVFLDRPAGYLTSFGYAMSLSGLDLRRVAMHFLYFVEAAMITRWMISQRLSRLHVHFATPAATVALFAAKIMPIRMSLTVHGPDEFYDVSHYLLPEKIAASDLLCTISSYARSQLMKLADTQGWGKIALTPLGVDPEIFSPHGVRQATNRFEVLCVGRLVPAKGQHILIEAIHRLLTTGRRLRLILAGDGPDRQSLEQNVRGRGIEEHVVFEGGVNQDRIRDLYSGADAFALASFAEGVPVVLMEAMAMEIPCVSTWVAGIPELIRDSIDGLLVPPSDAEALAAAIAQLMDDDALRRRLGRAGRLRVIEKYHLKKNVARLGNVFNGSLGAAA